MEGEISSFLDIYVMMQVLQLRQKNTAGAGLVLWTEFRAYN